MIAEADHDHDVPVVALSVMCRAAGAAGHVADSKPQQGVVTGWHTRALQSSSTDRDSDELPVGPGLEVFKVRAQAQPEAPPASPTRRLRLNHDAAAAAAGISMPVLTFLSESPADS
eukprot:1497040-Rhodomonas_salina.2